MSSRDGLWLPPGAVPFGDEVEKVIAALRFVGKRFLLDLWKEAKRLEALSSAELVAAPS